MSIQTNHVLLVNSPAGNARLKMQVFLFSCCGDRLTGDAIDCKEAWPSEGIYRESGNRLKNMEKLLAQMHGEEGEHESLPNSKRVRTASGGISESVSMTFLPNRRRTQRQSIPDPESQSVSSTEPTSRDGKPMVISYHGSSSGYYLLGSILSNGKEHESPGSRHGEESNDATQSGPKDEQHSERQSSSTVETKHTLIPTSKGIYRLRRMNVYDDDLMVVRDVTEAEKSNQIAVDQQETINNVVIDRQVLEGLVK